MNLPTREEINLHDSLDEKEAEKNFYGKSREDVLAMFVSKGGIYGEDFMWMGNKAFQYYLPVALAYLKTPVARADEYGDIDWLCNVLSFRIEHEGKGLNHSFKDIRQIAQYIVTHIDEFEDIDVEHTKQSYQALLNSLLSLALEAK